MSRTDQQSPGVGSPTDSRRLVEILAVIATGLAKFVFIDFFPLKFWYVLSSCLLWLAYIIFRISQDANLPNAWGFRRGGFRQSLKVVLPLSLIALGAFVFIGITNHTLVLNWHIIPILALYPVWGVIQQFLIIGLIAGNLMHMRQWQIPKRIVMLTASVVFSVVHYPSIPLVAATFLLALFYSWLYLKYRNLWILGIFHGWLGGFFYFLVLGRDPWLEFIQAIQ